MSNDELKPCPFPLCGDVPTDCRFVGDEDGGYWSIECTRKGVDHFAGVHGDTKAGTIKEWNTRPPLSEGDAREALEKASAWISRAWPATDESADWLNEGGWDEIEGIGQAVKAALAALPKPSEGAGEAGRDPLLPADNWREQGYTCPEAEIEDMANIGRAFMERYAGLVDKGGQFEGWSPLDDPTEFIDHLADQLAALSPSPTMPAGSDHD